MVDIKSIHLYKVYFWFIVYLIYIRYIFDYSSTICIYIFIWKTMRDYGWNIFIKYSINYCKWSEERAPRHPRGAQRSFFYMHTYELSTTRKILKNGCRDCGWMPIFLFFLICWLTLSVVFRWPNSGISH